MAGLRTAIVGLGNAGSRIHLPVVRRHPDLELVAACDLRESRLDDLPDDVAGYADLSTMIERETIDSAHVCTPPGTHVDVATTLLEAGIPVLIEKPLAPTTEAVDRLSTVAEETGLTASVVHNKLFSPPVREALAAVDAGEIGEVLSTTVLFSEPRDLAETHRGEWVFDLPGGEIGEGLPHQVYLGLAFVDGLGSVESVTFQNASGYEAVDLDGVIVECLDGTGDRTATIKVLANSISQDRVIVHGTDAQLEVDLLRAGTYRDAIARDGNSLGPRDFLAANLGEAWTLAGNVAGKVFETAREAYAARVDGEAPIPNKSHYRQVDLHARALRTGGLPPVSLQDGKDTIAVLEAVEDAAASAPTATTGSRGS